MTFRPTPVVIKVWSGLQPQSAAAVIPLVSGNVLRDRLLLQIQKTPYGYP